MSTSTVYPDTGAIKRPRRLFDTAKSNVSVEDLAHELCSGGLRRVSDDRMVARCPLPDHEDKTPSFYSVLR